MNLTLALFYLFSSVLVGSSLAVVSARNMVHAVMFLILCFVNTAAIFILLGAEFLAILLIVVYVGAIAVLFLFVVMMLNVDFGKLRQQVNRNLPILILLSVVMLCEIILITKFSEVKFYDVKTTFPTPNNINNTQAIGNILYTNFILPFQLSGCVLFVAMIGAIALTLKENKRFIKKQDIFNQTVRNKSNSLEIIKVRSGEGIDC